MYNADIEHNSQELSFENEFQKEHIGFSGKRIAILTVVLLLVAVGVAVAAILLKPSGNLVINEVVTSNHKMNIGTYGKVDWVELYNPTDRDIDLSGCGFTNSIKDLKRSVRYHFPDGTVLKSGGYLLLYCTGGTGETDDDPYCTGFNLSKEGETLLLVDRNYVELAELTVPALESDTAYARKDDGKYDVTTIPTPGGPNRFE